MNRNRSLAVAVIVLAAAACKQVATGGTPAATAAVDGYMAAWNAHEAVQAASFLADSAVYLDASVGTPQVGRDSAQKNVIQAFLTAVPDCRWTRDGDAVVNSAGDAIAFQWTFSGTNTGPWADGSKATGKTFSIKGLTLIRLTGGKISSQFDSYDALGFYKQLGMM